MNGSCLHYIRIVTSSNSTLKSVNEELHDVNGDPAWSEAVGSLDKSFPRLFFTPPCTTRQLPLIDLTAPSHLWFADPRGIQSSCEVAATSEEDESILDTDGGLDSSSIEVLHSGDSSVAWRNFPFSRNSRSPSLYTTDDEDSLFSVHFPLHPSGYVDDCDETSADEEDVTNSIESPGTDREKVICQILLICLNATEHHLPKKLTSRVGAKTTSPLPVTASHRTGYEGEQVCC